jgi:Methane oxygenase PmoA
MFVKHLVCSIALMTVPLMAAGLEWKDLGGGRLQLLDNGKPALVYNYGPQLAEGVPADRKRGSYIFPLYTPAGVSMTDDFPKDHYHHRGLFWGWTVVETGGKKYDLWMMRGGIEDRFERWVQKRATAKEALLVVENGWYADGVKVMKETVRLKTTPADANTRVLEVTLELESLVGPVTIKGSQEKGKSYGGLSVRFAPREQTRLTADTGAVAKDEDLVNHAWAALEAVYGGKRASLRIDSDAKNPGGAPQWCLRNYGFVGAAFPGQAGTTIDKGKPVRLQYTVTVKDLQ